jgi:hypothetical protein
VDALFEQGLGREVIVATIRAAELSGATEIEARRSNDAARQARRRERMKADLSRDSHVTSRESRDPLPPEKKGLPQTPSKENKPLSPSPLSSPDLFGGETSPAKPRTDYPPNAFDRWYAGYPHKVGRGAALASFERVRRSGRVTFAELVAGRDLYVSTKPADRPWCNPATWINQQRWNDQPAALTVVADNDRDQWIKDRLNRKFRDG